MTEPLSFIALIREFGQFGFAGLVLILWYFTDRTTRQILSAYKKDADDARRMYENNVELVKDYGELLRSYKQLARDTHDIVITNVQTMQTMVDAIRGNQFCPLNRIQQGLKG